MAKEHELIHLKQAVMCLIRVYNVLLFDKYTDLVTMNPNPLIWFVKYYCAFIV
jgi:hypothetical protein